MSLGKRFCIVVVASFSLATSIGLRADSLSNGLIAAYRFNGNASDSSGNNNNLTLVGNPAFVPGQFGRLALQLNGINQYAVGSTSVSLGSGDFTIAIFADLYQYNGSGQAVFIEDFSGRSGPGWTLNSPGESREQFYSLPGVVTTSNPAFSFNQWNLFLVERAGNVLELYVGNTLVEQVGVGGALTSSPNPLLIGTRDAQDDRNFTVDGALQDAGIWDRALTSSEINNVYTNGLPSGASSVPEPGALLLLSTGLTGLATLRQRHRLRK